MAYQPSCVCVCVCVCECVKGERDRESGYFVSLLNDTSAVVHVCVCVREREREKERERERISISRGSFLIQTTFGFGISKLSDCPD